jgi:hypothetical protein
MAKDRFSNQKPINWHSGFKQTGSFIKPYKSDINTVNKAVTQNTDKPKKALRTAEQTTRLETAYNTYSQYMSEWDREFWVSIIAVPFQISDKQKEILKTTFHKAKFLKESNTNVRP